MKANTPLNPMEWTASDQPGQDRSRTRRGFLMDMYRRLYRTYGPQGWWPGDGPFEVVLGAILTQAAAWTNVERALASLKAEDCWSLEAINRRPQEELAAIIRSSGYFNAKARKLKAFASHVLENYGGDLGAFLSRGHNELREELLGIYGIGPETADDIVLYAAGQPSFVIDAYTRRIIDRLGLLRNSPDRRLPGIPRPIPGQPRPRHRVVSGVSRPLGPSRQGGMRESPSLLRVLSAGTVRHGPRQRSRRRFQGLICPEELSLTPVEGVAIMALPGSPPYLRGLGMTLPKRGLSFETLAQD